MILTWPSKAAVIALVAAGASVSAQAPPPTQSRSLPIYEIEPAWPKIQPQRKMGDASSVADDAHARIWLLNRPRTLLKPEQKAMAAPPVIVFDGAGNYVKSWGGDGKGYEWPEREHGIYIDNRGFVRLGGNSCPTNGLPGLRPVADDQLLKFTQDGKFVMQIGHSNQSKGDADTSNLHRPADEWVYPPTNELFVADGYGNHRVAVFDADTGAFKRMWGAFGNPPKDDDHCEIYDPGINPDPGPPQFSTVHAVRIAKDGTVYIADRENRRVQMFTIDGKFIKQLFGNGGGDLALSSDPDQQFLYVGAGNKRISIVDRKTLEIVGTIQLPGMIGAGHEIATDSKGNLYIAQNAAGVQKLTFKGMSPASR